VQLRGLAAFFAQDVNHLDLNI